LLVGAVWLVQRLGSRGLKRKAVNGHIAPQADMFQAKQKRAEYIHLMHHDAQLIGLAMAGAEDGLQWATSTKLLMATLHYRHVCFKPGSTRKQSPLPTANFTTANKTQDIH
jgi:hypothetical protein